MVNAQADALVQGSFATAGVATSNARGSTGMPEISAGHHLHFAVT